MRKYRLPRNEQKEVEDQSRLLRAWKKFHREERETVLAGPHNVVLAELFRMFENLAHVQPVQLIGLVQSINWMTIDYTTKLVIVHELNMAITGFREKHGLDIDDPLPGQPESPFRAIRAIVFAPSPPDEGAHRGEARSESPATTDMRNTS
jgi:hypothetical protein